MTILPDWPPPDIVWATLRRARGRLRGLPITARPPLNQPINTVGLFTLAEQRTLTLAGYWPLPRRCRVWLQDRRRRPLCRLRADVREIAAAVARLERGAAR